MMYRSTPHSTTGVSPAQLLFGRRIRTKVPHLQEFSIEDEVRGPTMREKKRKRCMQTAKGQHVLLKVCKVLLKQEKKKKLSAPYKQSPFKVIQKNGNSVLVEADGVQYSRNVTHVKKYFERDYDVLPSTSKSSDDSKAQRATQSLSNQESREPVNVSSKRASGVHTI